jgi:lipopolysaccharide/colanic/teichoic acid biosynthesis glycosyltransferase
MTAYVVTPWLRPARDWVASVALRLAPSYDVYLRPFRPDSAELSPLSHLVWMLVVITPAVLLTLLAIDAYGRLRHISRTRMLLAGPFAAAAGMSVAALVIFLLRIEEWSRVFLFAFTVLTAIALTSVRAFIRAYHRWQERRGYYRRNLLLVGPVELMPRVTMSLRSRWSTGDFNIVGYAETSSPLPSDGSLQALSFSGAPIHDPVTMSAVPGAMAVAARPVTSEQLPLRLGSVAEIEEVLLRHPVHEVVAVLREGDSSSWMAGVIYACDHAGVPVRLLPEVLLLFPLSNLVVKDDHVGPGRKMPAILLAPRTADAEALDTKRLIDVIVSAIALLTLAPLLSVIAVLIRMSSRGRALYRYVMVGQNGKPFVGWKFRTMVPNANALKSGLLARNEMTGPVFKMKDDPRITKIGRWLRKFSLDELPQLYSVLKGDLSLVGPRPAGPDEYERYEFWQMRKVSVKPGITCLWQVRGRNGISNFDEWVKQDLEYIDNWSHWLDFKILVWTLFVVIKGTGR